MEGRGRLWRSTGGYRCLLCSRVSVIFLMFGSLAEC